MKKINLMNFFLFRLWARLGEYLELYADDIRPTLPAEVRSQTDPMMEAIRGAMFHGGNPACPSWCFDMQARSLSSQLVFCLPSVLGLCATD